MYRQDRLFQWIEAHKDGIFDDYKRLHQIPELGYQEVKTQAFLIKALEKEDFSVRCREGGTGFAATLESGEPGVVFALRAEMDALPLEERSGVPWASKHPGVMHACGHDANCVMTLWTARALKALGLRRGTLKLLYQPAEELLTGARAMLKTDLLRGVEEMVAIHLKGVGDLKEHEACAGGGHSAAVHLHADIQGRSAHGGYPHDGVNALMAASLAVQAVSSLFFDAKIPHSVKPTRLTAGSTAHNIVPRFAEMSFDLRSRSNALMREMLEKTSAAIENAVACNGACATLEVRADVPAAQEDPELLREAADAVGAVLGKCLPPLVGLGSEDFHCYAVEGGVRTAIIGLGANLRPGVHTNDMTFNLDALVEGVKILGLLSASKLC